MAYLDGSSLGFLMKLQSRFWAGLLATEGLAGAGGSALPLWLAVLALVGGRPHFLLLGNFHMAI